MTQRDRARVSFCIITAGLRPQLLEAVTRSIHAQQIPEYEIIVVGQIQPTPGLVCIPAEEHASAGRLGAMRNLAVASSRHPDLVILDDDILLAPDWYRRFCAFPSGFDILTSQIRLPDGSRYWDHTTKGGARGHVILDPGEDDAQLYMTGGGGWVIRREIAQSVGWDDACGFYRDEDVDFSRRCRQRDHRPLHNHASLVFHADGRYTTVGRKVVLRQQDRDQSWVLEEAQHLEPRELAERIQQHFGAGQIAEVADLLRLALQRHPAVPGFRSAWKELEDTMGGGLADARWSPHGDAAFLETMAEYSPSSVQSVDPPLAGTAHRTRSSSREFGINLFGFLSGNLGLGVAARSYLRLLMESGVDTQPVDIELPDYRSWQDHSFAEISCTLNDPTPHAVNLFVINPGDVANLIGRSPPALRIADRVNICIPFWELPRMPPAWIPQLQAMDIVCAASHMIRYALAADLSHVSLPYWPFPFYPPEGIVPERSRWGVPAESMMFVCAFEMASGFSRKNSLGAIDAFARAFGPEEDAFLVVKVNNAQGFSEPLSSLRQRARGDPRIVVVDEVLSYPEVLSLYASADAFVSLHRAEGFGLCLLEAMSLGKPAIATGWSGNMDFMTEQNACLVGYSLVPVHDETQPAYRPEFAGAGARWAEPRLEEAVHWMRRLAEDSELRERIGKRAGADMAERQARLSTDELLAAIRNVQEVKGGGSR